MGNFIPERQWAEQSFHSDAAREFMRYFTNATVYHSISALFLEHTFPESMPPI